MSHIDYFFSVFSPYTFFAGTRLEAIAKARGATITYHPIDLMGLFARTGGTPPKDRHENRKVYRTQDLIRQGRKRGLDLNPNPPGFPPNPAPASYAIIAAQKAGGGDLGALVHGLLCKVWVDHEDIGDDAVIADCLEAAGFDRSLAAGMMLAEAEEYARNLDLAVEKGAFGAPFYVTDDGERFWGHDRLDDLDAHLAEG